MGVTFILCMHFGSVTLGQGRACSVNILVLLPWLPALVDADEAGVVALSSPAQGGTDWGADKLCVSCSREGRSSELEAPVLGVWPWLSLGL